MWYVHFTIQPGGLPRQPVLARNDVEFWKQVGKGRKNPRKTKNTIDKQVSMV
jgi:hypothetical protein